LAPEPHYWSTWLPVGLLVGPAIGLTTVGLSSIAALSVGPKDYAAATGLNGAARQLGGALGVAVMTALLTSGHATVGAFTDSYLLCALTALAAAMVALGVRPTSVPRPGP
jgi:hypothetical protein